MSFRYWLLSVLLLAAAARADVSDDVQALIARGEFEAALARSEAAMKVPSPGARLRFLNGVALLELERDRQALATFVALTQDYPQLPEPYNNIAAIHARAGDWEQARQALELALRNDPTHRLARENLGDVHLQLAIAAWRSAALPERTGPALARKIRFATALAEQEAKAAPLARSGASSN